MNHFVRLCLIICLLAPIAALADKTDVVILKNGDKITGEVKRVGAGLLEFSTDHMGTIYIEWPSIAKIFSDTNQSIDTIDGRRFFGTMTALEEGEVIGIQTPTSLIELPTEELFSAYPVQATFWDRSDLDLSIGFDYQKSTDITELTLAADWAHRRPDRITEASLRANLTGQPNASDQRRSQINFSHQYALPDNRFKSWLGNIETNESLGLDLRLYAGGVFGNYLLRNTNGWLSVSYGLVGTHEEFADGTSQSGAEAVGNLAINYFRFADPERSLTTRLTVFPSLTEGGRVRMDFRTTFKLEFIDDLFWSMEAYYQSDNEPTMGAERNDYGITTSLGWTL